MIADKEYEILHQNYEMMLKASLIECYLLVYVKCNPELSLARVKTRNRVEEKKVDLQYLNLLHQKHESWLIHNEKFVPAPVLILDGTQDGENMIQEYEKLSVYMDSNF